jgi:hypothetical protein
MTTGGRAFTRALARLPQCGTSLFFLSALLLLSCRALWGWDSTFFEFFENFTSARMAAMGGLHSALADDASTLFSNPAGLRAVDRQITVSEVALSFYESAAEIAGETFFGSPGTTEDRRGIYSLWGPLAFSYVGKGRGFGIFSSSNVYLHAWGPSPSARVAIEENLVGIRARAFRIPLRESTPSTLDLGFSVVGFVTFRGVFETDIREVFLSGATFQDLLAASGLFRRAMGAGLEFGIRYAYKEFFAVGLAARNLSVVQAREFATIQDFLSSGASTAWYNMLPLDLTAGIMFRPPLGRLSRIFSDLVFVADYRDIFDWLVYPPGATNPLLHIALGLELRLLEIISLRGGYYQCLPSFGLGLDLSLFKLNLAYFGRELSGDPGGYSVGCYTIGVEFSY